MFYKKKYQEALEETKRLNQLIKDILKDNTDRQWQMLCKISKLGEENEKLEKEIRQYRENSNPNGNA